MQLSSCLTLSKTWHLNESQASICLVNENWPKIPLTQETVSSLFIHPSVRREHHVYKTECSPKPGERLVCRKDERKEAKEHDEYAVGTFIQESSKLVGHVPIELSFLVFTFLRAHEDNQVVVEVTGSRKLENGLVIPGTFRAVTRSRRLGESEVAMCSHGYFYQGNEKQTCATLKGHYCLYYLTMSRFIKRTV